MCGTVSCPRSDQGKCTDVALVAKSALDATGWYRYLPVVPAGLEEAAAARGGAPAPHPAPCRDPDLPNRLLAVGADGTLLAADPLVVNPSGVVHGGLVAWALERAARAVVGPGPASATQRTIFVRPAVAPLTCTGRVVHGGRALAVVDVSAARPDGRTCAVGTVTLRGTG